MIKARLSPRSAQILVILLIALAILSILVVAVASTARRDQVSRIQNEQYEQSLSIGEEIILEIVRDELDITDPSSNCTSRDGGIQYECDYEITSDSTGALEAFTVIVSEEVSSEAQNLTVGVDKGVSINLDNGSATGFTGSIEFDWIGDSQPAPVVSWAVSIDYIDESDNYQTLRMLLAGGGMFPGADDTILCNAITANGTLHTLDFGNVHTDCLGDNGKLLAVRFVPLSTEVSSVDLSITGVGGGQILPQFKKITTQVYSKNATNASTPVAILEATIPLNSNPLEFLDYVYRSGP